jgi:hypothetical protein
LSQEQLAKIARLISFEKQIRETRSLVELQYTITNELRNIIPYTQSFFGYWPRKKNIKIASVSDIAVVDRTSIVVSTIERIAKKKMNENFGEVHSFTIQGDEEIISDSDHHNYIPSHLVWVPCASVHKGKEGILILTKNTEWTSEEIELLKHISGTIGYALSLFLNKNILSSIFKFFVKGWFQFLIAITLIAAMFVNVSLSTLGPAEIIPQKAIFITSTIDGVIKEIKVENNDQIEIDQPLVEFETAELNSQYQLSLGSLNIAKAELLRAKQSSFASSQEKAKIKELEAQVSYQEEDLAYQKALLARAIIKSPSSGIAIIGQKSQIIGQPFSVGQKIFTLADPKKIQVQIMVPVKDSITIKEGAQIKLFLDTNPLKSIDGSVVRFNYEPEKTAQGILSYRVLALINNNQITPRIGLRGTAKIYGQQVKLFFYLFRKPITTLRQFIGF